MPMAIPVNITGLVIAAQSLKSVSVVFGLVTILFGVLVIWQPKILAYLIGAYLIILGIGLVLGGFL